MNNFVMYSIVIALGAFTGGVEIIGRYKDAPLKALKTLGGFFYVLVNVLAAVIGLLLLQSIGTNFISETDPVKRSIYEILIAGLGSLAFLRSSIFKVRFNDIDVSVGPAALLDTLLLAADRGVDRRRGKDRAADVASTMEKVSFDKAYPTLPPFCFALLQNLDEDEQKAFSTQVKLVADNIAIHPHVKSLLLGLSLMNIVGVDVLRAAAASLADHIKYDTAPPTTPQDESRIQELLKEARKALDLRSGRAEMPSATEAPPRPARSARSRRPAPADRR
jgi:hypothetical protein